VSPDQRQHRGPHPADQTLFAPEHIPALREATAELSWLLSRGYAINSALKLVGDRHGLTERQRAAVARAACSDQSLARRRQACVPPERLSGEPVIVDGFNLIVTLEAALSGGVIILCRDGCLRDLSSVHGSYRAVQETPRALRLIGEALAGLGVREARWLLDRPVSNSGRLAGKIREVAEQAGWTWSVELVFNPDADILSAALVALTSDSAILDRVGRWANLTAHMYATAQHTPWMIDLRI
jgi:hypothetical protein